MLFPPRPEGKMFYKDLPRYEKSGKWLAQRKYNGIRNVIHLKDGKVNFYTRDCEQHSPKNFLPKKQYIDEVLGLNLDHKKEFLFDSELMTKQIGSKKEIILFDILMYEGIYLFGKPNLEERYKILKNICCNIQNIEGIPYSAIDKKLYLIDNFYINFLDRFNESLNDPRIEGLVIKKKDSFIDSFGKKYNESKWLIRCRKPFSDVKGYNF